MNLDRWSRGCLLIGFVAVQWIACLRYGFDPPGSGDGSLEDGSWVDFSRPEEPGAGDSAGDISQEGTLPDSSLAEVDQGGNDPLPDSGPPDGQPEPVEAQPDAGDGSQDFQDQGQLSDENGSDAADNTVFGFVVVVNSSANTVDFMPGDGVCDTDDSSGDGPCTLRAAIEEANSVPLSRQVRIAFGVPESDPNVDPVSHVVSIQIGTGLTMISRGMEIDGWTQGGGGYVGPPLILLNGNNSIGTGLVTDFTSSGVTVRGLILQGFMGQALLLQGSDHVVEGCFIGTDETGALTRPNQVGILLLDCSNTRIGGTDHDLRTCNRVCNLISGNTDNGIEILASNGGTSEGITILGNFTGTDRTGSVKLGNGGGIYSFADFGQTVQNIQVGGPDDLSTNLISGNQDYGIHLDIATVPATANVIENNLIGLNAMGLSALGNMGNGIEVTQSYGASNLIQGNTLSGNGRNGAALIGPSITNGNALRGNRIGTNRSGTLAVSNGENGVLIDNADDTKVGADFVTSFVCDNNCNLISGNSLAGVMVKGSIVADPTDDDLPPDSPEVFGNFIGTDITGMLAIPNGKGIYANTGKVCGFKVKSNLISGNLGPGVELTDIVPSFCFGTSSHEIWSNRIGVNVSGFALPNLAQGILMDRVVLHALVTKPFWVKENLILGNSAEGIRIQGTNQTKNILLYMNSLASNGGLGINLVGGTEDAFGITANDMSDLDDGPNSLLNFPVITSAIYSTPTLTVQGECRPGAGVQFFKVSPDPSLHGESVDFLFVKQEGAAEDQSSAAGSADPSANAFLFSFDGLDPAPSPGDQLTATASDLEGNTSEEALNVLIQFP